MKQYTYDNMSQDIKNWRAVGFLQALHRNGVPVQDLMTNDWENVPSPKVYVLDKPYKRFSDYDFTNALNYWKRMREGK
jgi:hypothetical protein